MTRLQLLLRLHLLLIFGMLLSSLTLGQPRGEIPEYVIEEAGQTNVFLDDDLAQVHLLLRPQSRFVLAFPAENSGMAMWFQGMLKVVPNSLRSLPVSGSGQHVQVRLLVTEPTVIEKAVLDSIRTIRSETEGVPTAEAMERARQASSTENLKTTTSRTGDTIRYERRQRYLSSNAGNFQLSLTPASLNGQGDVLLSPGQVTIEAKLPFAPMTRFRAEELYSPAYLSALERSPGRVDDSLRALEFLARREKMMAGSWRFLTYFGRDTLISLAMLEPILSDQALLAGVQSVLERLSKDGMVAHEEDIGPWAEWRHLQDPSSGEGLEPVYDHKMVDDDLLLPVLLAKLRENGRGAVVDALLKEPESRRAVLANADYVLGLLAAEKSIRLNPGESTGDWRDSSEGLGGGVYPASVNADLALPALDALVSLYRSLDNPPADKLVLLDRLRPVWAKLADGYWMELSPAQVKSRLRSFAETLPAEQKSGFERLLQARADLLGEPFRFPVLSFNDDGSPVVVPHTDVAFTLFYGHPSQTRLAEILTLLERPFPYGLATPAGHVVASPVFSADKEHYRSLGFGQYHGLVVWSWPSAMLQFGLLRQRGRFPALDGRIRKVLADIEQSEQRVGPLATSELWAVGLDQKGLTWRGYGTAGDQTESNALQLWSTVYPALEFARLKAAEEK